MRKWLSVFIAFALIWSVFAYGPGTQIASAADITVNPVADTDTQSDVAAGTNATLNVSQWNNLFAKFSLSGVPSSIAAAKIRIYHPTHSVNHNLIVNGASTESWSEGGAKPALGSQINSKAVNAVGYVELDVTAAVQAKLSASSSSATFGFSSNIGSWEVYQSREGSSKPELIITPNAASSTTTLNPVADTDTQSDVAAGTNAALNVSQWNNLFAKFSLSGVASTITSAKLRINHTGHANNHTLIVSGASTESWSEGGAKPALGSQIATKSVTANGYVEIDVTSAVQSKLSASSSSVTFGLSTNLGSWEVYQSRESGTKPELVITAGGGTSPPTNPPSGTMKIGTNFWFMGTWSGETPFKSTVNWATAYANGDDVWNPTFTAELAPYTTLRFMDWGGTNNSKVQTWSQRRLPTDPVNSDIGYIGPSDPLRAGLAYEWMIDLCNRTNKDMWVTLPHMADNNYANQLATLIKSKLNSNLKVYVEYSNETWNGGFSQFQYTIDQGTALNLPGSNQWYKGGAFSLYRSVQIWNQFATVYGSEMAARVARVASFSGNYDIFDQGYANVVNSTTWNPTNQKADMIAIAPYVGSGLDGASASIQSQFHADIDATFNDRVLTAVAIAQKYNVKLGCYEGGQHLLTNADQWSGNQNIYTEYTYMLNKFAPYFVLYNHYAHAGSWSSGGAWGAKAFTGQSNAAAPKYRAIVDWVAAHP
ncbi:CBM96 family carbohydrate-binding protein [Paenibacillus silvisoli]|uniref:CBM96 family carbohydrate-binding protein n=1 Tax=Paenibacillus silvisoli TaxID=3110539 RepID=UPI002804CE0E|nr:DNRLRE domain-containing protein [Paenibacillus silvisoli]